MKTFAMFMRARVGLDSVYQRRLIGREAVCPQANE